MPNMANVAVVDGKGTPATHTFTPVTSDGWTAQWVNRLASSLYKGWERLTISFKESRVKGQANPYGVTTEIPVIQQVGGVDVVIRVSGARTTYFLAQDASDAEVADLVAIHNNTVTSTAVRDAVKLRQPWH